MTMKCTGIDALTGRAAAVSFDAVVQAVEDGNGASAGRYLAPGFIDLQVNGFAAVDYNLPDTPIEEIARSIRALFATGVTRFYPTVITGSPANMAGALRNLAEARERLPEGAAIEGIHLEGPHISPEDGARGAHPRRWVRRPDLHELHQMQEAARGLVRLVTLSPEWPEATRFIEGAVRDGIVVSIGHTNANSAQIAEAVSAGATMSTHLGNGAHNVLPRHPNYIWDQLAEDRLAAGFIADGIHLPAAFLKTALRAKGPLRSVLVTDAALPAGAPIGRYQFGEQAIESQAGSSRGARGNESARRFVIANAQRRREPDAAGRSEPFGSDPHGDSECRERGQSARPRCGIDARAAWRSVGVRLQPGDVGNRD